MKVWDFCAEKSRSIEVVYRDDDLEEEVLTRVHFNVNVEVTQLNLIYSKVSYVPSVVLFKV